MAKAPQLEPAEALRLAALITPTGQGLPARREPASGTPGPYRRMYGAERSGAAA